MAYNFIEIQTRFKELIEDIGEIKSQLEKMSEVFNEQEPDLNMFYVKLKNHPGARVIRNIRAMEKDLKLLKTDLLRHRTELKIIKGTSFEKDLKPAKRTTAKDPNRFTA